MGVFLNSTGVKAYDFLACVISLEEIFLYYIYFTFFFVQI